MDDPYWNTHSDYGVPKMKRTMQKAQPVKQKVTDASPAPWPRKPKNGKPVRPNAGVGYRFKRQKKS